MAICTIDQTGLNAPLTLTSSTLTSPTLSNPTFTGTATGTVLVSGTAVTSTSGTAISFTSIPSWVKRITVMFNGVSTTGTSIIQVQLGTSGGLKTSGYGGTVAYMTSTVGTTAVTTGIGVGASNSAAHVREGIITITNLTGNTWVGTSVIALSSSAEMSFGGGSTTLSGTLTQLAINTVGGTDTFDAGIINILYE